MRKKQRRAVLVSRKYQVSIDAGEIKGNRVCRDLRISFIFTQGTDKGITTLDIKLPLQGHSVVNTWCTNVGTVSTFSDCVTIAIKQFIVLRLVFKKNNTKVDKCY